jgi:hypothetical protein
MNAIAANDIINSATPLETTLVDQHPRLHLTPARLAFLRENRERAPWADMLAAVCARSADARNAMDTAGTASRGAPGGALPHIALSWRVFGDDDDLALARAIMRQTCQYGGPDGHGSFGGCWLYALGIAFDWLYDDLDQETLDETADYIQRRSRECFEQLSSYGGIEATWYTCNHLPNYLYDLAAGGMAIYGHRPDIAPQLRLVLATARQMIHSLGPDGVSQEGICYGGFYTDLFVRTLDLVDQLLGNDLFAQSEWLKNTWAFHQYSALPREAWVRSNTIMGFGDGAPYHWHGPDSFLFRLAAYHRNPHAQWLAHELFRERLTGSEGHYLNPLWCAPDLEGTPPNALPRFRHFEDQGMVFMRSDWDGAESMLGFHCAPHSGHFSLEHFNTDHGGGHMYPDAGAFQLFVRGDRLLTHADYTVKQTAYRNTILVNGIGQTGENSVWFESLELRRERRGPRIVHAAAHPDYDVVTADLTDAYEHRAQATRLVRHLVYLRPSCWLVVDVLAAGAPSRFESLFHFGPVPQPLDDSRFDIRGDRGALRLSVLSPDAAVSCETQGLKGTGSTHPDETLELVRVSNRESAANAVFATMLEACSVGESPGATGRVVDNADGTLAVHVETLHDQYSVTIGGPGAADPAVVTKL